LRCAMLVSSLLISGKRLLARGVPAVESSFGGSSRCPATW
jgi:hypothetical protein